MMPQTYDTHATDPLDRLWIEPDEVVAELAALARLRWDWLSHRRCQEILEARAWQRLQRDGIPAQRSGEAA